jgi:hypothetical protein
MENLLMSPSKPPRLVCRPWLLKVWQIVMKADGGYGAVAWTFRQDFEAKATPGAAGRSAHYAFPIV